MEISLLCRPVEGSVLYSYPGKINMDLTVLMSLGRFSYVLHCNIKRDRSIGKIHNIKKHVLSALGKLWKLISIYCVETLEIDYIFCGAPQRQKNNFLDGFNFLQCPTRYNFHTEKMARLFFLSLVVSRRFFLICLLDKAMPMQK